MQNMSGLSCKLSVILGRFFLEVFSDTILQGSKKYQRSSSFYEYKDVDLRQTQKNSQIKFNMKPVSNCLLIFFNWLLN